MLFYFMLVLIFTRLASLTACVFAIVFYIVTLMCVPAAYMFFGLFILVVFLLVRYVYRSWYLFVCFGLFAD